MTRAKMRRIRKARARLAFAMLTHNRDQPRDYLGHELLVWAIDLHWDRHERPPGYGRPMIGARP
jgi:hypothetical protein